MHQKHFKGKEPLAHVIEARRKGYVAAEETHGTELPGHYSAAADAAKETALILIVLWMLVPHLWISLSFITGWLFWKVGRSAILGWARLERLHRLIEAERWEIEHHRPQEKEELLALYRAKGFSGKLLEEVVDVLMSDDNRLLEVMLQEELKLNLESFEHPLKQATGACFGVVGAAAILFLALFAFPAWGPIACGALIIALSSWKTAELQKNQPLPSIIWNLAVAMLATGAAYFAAKTLSL